MGAIERAKQVTAPELNSIIRVRDACLVWVGSGGDPGLWPGHRAGLWILDLGTSGDPCYGGAAAGARLQGWAGHAGTGLVPPRLAVMFAGEQGSLLCLSRVQGEELWF